MYAALRFYATGTFQNMVGDSCGLSRQSVGNIIQEVSREIALLRDEFIYMPRNRAELVQNFKDFFEVGNFPTVVGTIDCSHIKISGQGGSDGEMVIFHKWSNSIRLFVI